MDPIERTQKCSDAIINLLTEDKTLPGNIAAMACLDAAIRIVKAATGRDDAETIITLENTLQAIRESQGG
jgi:hypothetical protein